MKKPQYLRIVVDVKQEHIAKGVRSEPGQCPIALALQGMGYKNARVGLSGAQLNWDGPMYEMDYESRKFVLGFDMPEYFGQYVDVVKPRKVLLTTVA